MPDSFDLNNQPRAADAVPQIPTSASEVAVRTMASDLELMGQSGGMIGQSVPQSMQVPVTLHPETAASLAGAPASASAPAPQASRSFGRYILITVIVILAVFGLLALGYFVIG